jgi:WS/DGAT/MGAT family acyltransferase
MGAYERLSAVDAVFLDIEDDHDSHMHVGGIIVLEAGAVTLAHGGIDFARIRAQVDSAVLRTPRLRQRIERAPGFNHPVWVEDPYFCLDYHFRHAALPQPGSMADLQRLAGRIFSQRLDRERPLWEIWLVEGLSGNRFALIPKIHHCLMDGMGAVGLMAAFSGFGSTGAKSDDLMIAPRATPSALFWGELQHRLEGVRGSLRDSRSPRQREGNQAFSRGDLAKGLSSALKRGLTQATVTPFNPEKLGQHRRFETVRMSLKEIKAIKNELGGTVNDVVLTLVAGASRRYLARRGVDLTYVETFRALVPANVRASGEHELGNRLSFMLAALPIQEPCPLRQYQLVHEETAQRKHDSLEIQGAEFVGKVDDRLGLGLISTSFKTAINRRAFNIIVTNVPGPPMKLPLFGANVVQVHPLVPLFTHQALGIAVFSYQGSLFWGLNADWDVIPDLDLLASDLSASLEALKSAAFKDVPSINMRPLEHASAPS